MCCGRSKICQPISSTVYQDGNDSSSEICIPTCIPEHSDSINFNRDLRYGILGFRYENKDGLTVVYSSPEAKTVCILMKFTPLKN